MSHGYLPAGYWRAARLVDSWGKREKRKAG